MHVKKDIVGELYKLQKKHKVLSSEIIKYLSKCFGFAVRTSKDNADGVRQNLLCIVPHAFGCHDNCGAWCGYAKDPASYRHKSLPWERTWLAIVWREILSIFSLEQHRMQTNLHPVLALVKTKALTTLFVQRPPNPDTTAVLGACQPVWKQRWLKRIWVCRTYPKSMKLPIFLQGNSIKGMPRDLRGKGNMSRTSNQLWNTSVGVWLLAKLNLSLKLQRKSGKARPTCQVLTQK